jgi:hypothetical protein
MVRPVANAVAEETGVTKENSVPEIERPVPAVYIGASETSAKTMFVVPKVITPVVVITSSSPP